MNDVKKGKGAVTKEIFEAALVKKIQGVFRPDDDVLGRLVNRIQGGKRAEISILFKNGDLSFGFGNRQEKHIDIDIDNIPVNDMFPIFIPPKEIISSISNFASLYDDYHIDIEETYYDLARLLDKPLKKGPNTAEQKQVMSSFETILNGNVIQENKKFYLKIKGEGNFEMGLVSEGYRKLSTIIYLILSGSISKNTVLFWDEPEINMNPKMIKPVVEAVTALAKMGVQVFVATHDYFVQQCFNLIASYPKANTAKLEILFISLYREIGESGKPEIKHQSNNSLSDLPKNSIMEEFDALYDREQELI
jgi:hypothetical protein